MLSLDDGLVRVCKAQKSGRKDHHGNEGASLWYRPMAVSTSLVSIVHRAQSAEPANFTRSFQKERGCMAS